MLPDALGTNAAEFVTQDDRARLQFDRCDGGSSKREAPVLPRKAYCEISKIVSRSLTSMVCVCPSAHKRLNVGRCRGGFRAPFDDNQGPYAEFHSQLAHAPIYLAQLARLGSSHPCAY